MNARTPISFANRPAALIALLLMLMAGKACAQLTDQPLALIITNFTGYVIAGDTNLGGRQALQVAESLSFNLNGTTPATNVCLLQYSLLNQSGQPVPIIDQTGHSNLVYSVYETNSLPVTFGSTVAYQDQVVYYAPLQPFNQLNYYMGYTPQIQVYSSPWPTNSASVFQYSGQAYGPTNRYFDFTNTVSPTASPDVEVVLTSTPNLLRTWSVSNSPAEYGFPVQVSFTAARYDNFTLPPTSTNLMVTLNFQLINTNTGASVPLQSSQSVFNVSIASNDGSTPPNPIRRDFNNTVFNLKPAAQLDSVDDVYQVVVSLSHTLGSTTVNDATNASLPTQLLDFNGQFYFGSLLTIFTNLDVAPTFVLNNPGVFTEYLLAPTANSGGFPQAPGYSYGGQLVYANLLPNGSLEFATGQININAPTTSQTIGNISFQTAGPILTPSGASETVTLTLPTGFSMVPPGAGNRLTVSTLSLGNVPLAANLNPQNVTIPGPIQAISESVPFWFCGPSLLWNVAAGQLQLVLTNGAFARQTEDDVLTASQSLLADPTMVNRVSNDGYYRNASIVPTQALSVSADANGNAQISAYIQLNPVELRPHFPYSGSQEGVQISIGSSLPNSYNGAITFDHGAIVLGTGSFLAATLNTPAPLVYWRDTHDTNCASSLAGVGTMSFTPAFNYNFTADGGLLAYGSVPVTNVTWGYIGDGNYAQEVLNVQNCVFEMAGTCLQGGQSAVDSPQLPAVLMLSGFGNGTNLTGANATYVERPGTFAYSTGMASYPGINFIAPVTGQSCIGGTSIVQYPLAQDAKYYARYGGVSGIHDTVDFPAGVLQVYGYPFAFNTYRLSYLDSEVHQTLVAGSISFPANPSGFTQAFTNLILTDQGFITSATVPPSSPNDHLNYWNVDLAPKSIEFAPHTDDSCGTGPRSLVLGVETRLPLIPQALHAALGFRPDGNLITVTDNVAGCDSRIAVPAQLTLTNQSKSQNSFQFSSCAEGYFNNYLTPGSPQNGFFNLAGKIRLPFFTDVRTHLHVTPGLSQVDIMGGWPDPDAGVTNAGWNEGVSNFFNTAKFDPSSAGFPADQGYSLNDYEQSPYPQFNPQIYRNWIQVATFNYSIVWDPIVGHFTGLQPGSAALPIITVDSNLKELTPGKVDMDFAEDITLGLPVAKVLDFLNDAVGVDSVFGDVSNAVQSALGFALDNGGLNELQGVLREDSTAMFQPILNQAFGGVAANIRSDIASLSPGQSQAQKTLFLQTVASHIQTEFSAQLSTALKSINGAANKPNTLIGQVNKSVSDAGKDVNQFVSMLAPDGGGGHGPIAAIMGNLISDQSFTQSLGPLASDASSVLPNVNSLIGSYGPCLNELHTEFKSLEDQFNDTLGDLTNSSSDFVKSLEEPLNNPANIQSFVTQFTTDLTNYLAGAITPAGDALTANPTAVQQAIQQQLQNAFLNSPLVGTYQTMLRQFLFDNNATMDELMNDTFDQVNSAIRDGFENAIEKLETSDTDYKALNNMSTFLSAKIKGSPTFNGDSLREIHLSAALKMHIPEDMTFNGFMDIKELCSQTVPVDCIPPGDPAAEITVGAKHVELDWPGVNESGTPLYLTIEGKWTLQDGNVIGVGGLFDLLGPIGVDGYSINEVGATFAFGEEENYLAAKVAGTFTILGVPVNANGGLFVGEACSTAPILFIDPLASSTLQAAGLTSFSGIYANCGVGLSLSEILFGTSSCFLDLGANVSEACYYESTDVINNFNIGTRQSIDVNASLLCLISGSVTVTLSEIAQGQLLPPSLKLTVAGDADLCGSIGPCPFCISGCKNIYISGSVGTGGCDYHVDY